MLPPEVLNLKTQVLLKEISTEDFFCLLNAMYEFDEAKAKMAAILSDLKADLQSPKKQTDHLLYVYTQLTNMARNLYGEEEMAGNEAYGISYASISSPTVFNDDDYIYER